MDVNGTRVLVTGASSGLRAAAARLPTERGATVICLFIERGFWA